MKTLLLATFLLFVPATNALAGPVIDEEVGPPDTLPDKKTVKPGTSHCNGDSVCVTNTSPGTQDATITPATGDATSDTTVATDTKFTGSVTGLDSTDTVNLGSSNTTSISGTGGTVNAQGGSTITVTNSADTGGAPINVNLPGVLVRPAS